MEFFEFDTSFIGGKGELHTDHTTGNESVVVTDNSGQKVRTTCVEIQNMKTAQAAIGNNNGYCITDMPYKKSNPKGEGSAKPISGKFSRFQ